MRLPSSANGFTYAIAAAALGALVALLSPLLQEGLALGSDTAMHVGNVVESAHLMGYSFRQCGWLPDVAGGYGGPNYVYYNALGFLFPAVVTNCGVSPVAAVKVWIACIILVGFISSYLWCSLFVGRMGAIIGALMFVWSPYYFTLPYVRGSYPEFCALSLYPLPLYFGSLWLRRGSMVYLAVGASVTGFIIGTHTLSLLLMLPPVCLFLLLGNVGNRLMAMRLCGFILCSLIIAGPCLAGPLFERGKVDIERQFATADLFTSMGIPWLAIFNRHGMVIEDQILSYIVPGRLHVLALLCAGSALLCGYLNRTYLTAWLIAMSSLLATLQGVASVLVTVCPTLRFVQFPWRFLGIFSLFVCPVAAGFIEAMMRGRLGMLIGVCVSILVPAVYIGYIPPQSQNQFETASRAGIRQSFTTLDHENKYMPAGVKLTRRRAPSVLLSTSDPGSTVGVIMKSPCAHVYRVNASKRIRVTFHQYWFDRWGLVVDGQPGIMGRDGEGLCQFTVDSGEHEIKITFEIPAWERWLAVISLTMLVILSVSALSEWCFGAAHEGGARGLRRHAPQKAVKK